MTFRIPALRLVRVEHGYIVAQVWGRRVIITIDATRSVPARSP